MYYLVIQKLTNQSINVIIGLFVFLVHNVQGAESTINSNFIVNLPTQLSSKILDSC